MTKKHFIQLADDVKWHNGRYPDNKFSEEQLRTLACFCKSQNPRFDAPLWYAYIRGECGPSGGAVKK